MKEKKAMECFKLSELFYKRLEEKHGESNTDDGCLTCAFQKEAKTLPGLCNQSVVSSNWGLKNQSSVFNGRPEALW